MTLFSKFKILFILIFILGFFTFFTSICYAADFQFDYNVNYSVSESGLTDIKHDITITNLTSNYYTQSFTLTTTSSTIKNISAWDSSGQIKPETEIKDDTFSIKVNFNEKVVGLNKQLKFTIQYESPDIASKKGNIWEVIIPGILKDNNISSYNIHLQTPQSFGNAAYVFPKPNQNGYWSLQELNQGGINIIYGNKQIYSFNLIYNLSNQNNTSQIQEIALPPDTAFQKVILSRISVLPDNVISDADGNWLAQYKLKPKEKLKIVAEGNILIYMEPFEKNEKNLSVDEIHSYTTPLKYWENTPDINQKAKELKTPRNMYDWIVNNLSYDYDIQTTGSIRNGAAYILNHSNIARCMDFSDLFVALARNANIPAREIHGFAYTTNSRLQPLSQTSDVLHAWPQYFDFEKKNWISIDPTWGNTTHGIDYFDKLDFNHVALAILGKESDYPYPAGSFYSDNSTKNVYVTLSDKDVTVPLPQYLISIKNTSIFYGLDKKIILKINNNGNVLLKSQNADISSDLKTITDIEIPSIPPYGYVEIPISIYPKFSFFSKNYNLSFSYYGKQKNFSVLIKPIFSYGFPFSLLLPIFGIIVYFKYGKRKS